MRLMPPWFLFGALLCPQVMSFSMRLHQRKVALVTGANRGLGLALSDVLASEGYHVIMTSRRKEEGELAADRVRASGGSVTYLQLDVTDEGGIDRVAEHVRCEHGALDLLVNNAGVCVRHAEAESLHLSLEVNAMAPLRLMEALMTGLGDDCGGRDERCVINVSSGDGELVYLHSEIADDLSSLPSMQEWEAYVEELRSSRSGWATRLTEAAHQPWPAYCLSKAVLNAATRILGTSTHTRAQGLAVTAVCPGDVLTDMCDVPLADRSSSARLLSPTEAARDVLWVAQNPHLCPSGHFYRQRQRIPW